MEDMATVHMSEAEVARDLHAVLARVQQGVEVVIEQDHRPIAVLKASRPVGRMISEIVADLRMRGSDAVSATRASGVDMSGAEAAIWMSVIQRGDCRRARSHRPRRGSDIDRDEAAPAAAKPLLISAMIIAIAPESVERRRAFLGHPGYRSHLPLTKSTARSLPNRGKSKLRQAETFR